MVLPLQEAAGIRELLANEVQCNGSRNRNHCLSASLSLVFAAWECARPEPVFGFAYRRVLLAPVLPYAVYVPWFCRTLECSGLSMSIATSPKMM
jgi:hypothetical protein